MLWDILGNHGWDPEVTFDGVVVSPWTDRYPASSNALLLPGSVATYN